MPDASFRDGLGVEPDAGVALGYLRSWHGSLDGGGARLVSLLCLPSRWCLTVELQRVVGQIEGAGLDELVFPSGVGEMAGVVPQSVYISAGTLAQNPGRGKRGGRKDSGVAPGVWLDLDVGELGSGRFSGWSQIIGLVEEFDRAGVGPTMIVASGSGGAHLYWHVGDEAGLEPGEVEEYGRRMRLWAERRSGLLLDRVENCDRVLRLPGSVRWPKPAERGGSAPGLCSVVREWGGGRVSRAGVEELTDEVWAEWSAQTEEVRRADREGTRRALLGLIDLDLGPGAGGSISMDWGDDNPWGAMWGIAWAEDLYGESVSWASILEPCVWRRNGLPDAEGRVEWTRPGGGEHSSRSLVTDWYGSPNVASLLSLAPETGLLRLEAAGAALTKARVAAELYYGGDLRALLTAFMSERGSGSVGGAESSAGPTGAV